MYPETYALYRFGDLRGASSAYQITVENWPHHFGARMRRGFTLHELGEFRGAEAEWLAAVRLNPKQPFARAGLAVGLYGLRQIEEAKEQHAAEPVALDETSKRGAEFAACPECGRAPHGSNRGR